MRGSERLLRRPTPLSVQRRSHPIFERSSFPRTPFTRHDGRVRILWRPRHRPITAKVFRVPTAEVLQPGLPAGRVAGRPQGRVQAAPGGGLLVVLVFFAVSLGNVYVGNSRRGGGRRRRRDFKPISRCPVGGRAESWSLILAGQEEDKEEEEEQIQNRHHKRTRGQRRAEHHPRSH